MAKLAHQQRYHGLNYTKLPSRKGRWGEVGSDDIGGESEGDKLYKGRRRERVRNTEGAVWNGQQQGQRNGGAEVAVERQTVTWKRREKSAGARLGGWRAQRPDFTAHHSDWEAWKHSCNTRRMITASGWLWTRTHQHTLTANINFIGVRRLFWCLFTLLLLRLSFKFRLPGGCWWSESKAFDHGDGMKASPQTIAPLIIRAVSLNWHKMKHTSVHLSTTHFPPLLSASLLL